MRLSFVKLIENADDTFQLICRSKRDGDFAFSQFIAAEFYAGFKISRQMFFQNIKIVRIIAFRFG
jgi:hypothetical protein